MQPITGIRASPGISMQTSDAECNAVISFRSTGKPRLVSLAAAWDRLVHWIIKNPEHAEITLHNGQSRMGAPRSFYTTFITECFSKNTLTMGLLGWTDVFDDMALRISSAELQKMNYVLDKWENMNVR